MLGNQAVHGDARGAAAAVRRWLWSEGRSLGFERDLRVDFEPPRSRVAMRVVDLDAAMAKKLFVFDGLSGPDWTRLTRRLALWREGFEGGFVTVDSHGEPLFLQWVFPPSERDHLTEYFGVLFPPLPPDTILGEGIWIPPAHRGRGIMAEALSLVAEVAHEKHPQVTKEMAFVDESNIASIKGHERAGFARSSVRVETWRAGVLHTEFTPLSPSSTPSLSPATAPR
jgi:hypothetical protein